MRKVHYKGEELLRLIPQRNPMVMVDELSVISRHAGRTALHVRPDNMFVYKNGELAETGLIEHMAQSAVALGGHSAPQPFTALIGEVKHFDCARRPRTGDTVVTAVTFSLCYAGTTIVNCISSIDGDVVARTQMKIFVQ